jgi:hypothetical protein
MVNFKKSDSETNFSFIKRMVSYKLSGEFNGSYTEWYNLTFNKELSEDVARRQYYGIKDLVIALGDDEEDLISNIDENYETKELYDLIQDLKKERIKIRDERNTLNEYIRKEARRDANKELALECVDRISKEKPFEITNIRNKEGNKKGILVISDFHYGEIVDNFSNTYNTKIARDRIKLLIEKTIYYGLLNKISTLYLINLNDLISGLIHLRLRLESREDVITQTLEVSDILCDMIYELQKHFNIEYYDCSDNHSRLDANKKDALPMESFTRIIKNIVQKRFCDFKNVNINDNRFGDDIISFNIFDFNYAGVHGDKDNFATVVSNLSLMTKQNYDVILTAHKHHFACDEQNETVVISNGSLMGTNSFAKDLRLASKASQTMIIVDKECSCESIHRLILN